MNSSWTPLHACLHQTLKARQLLKQSQPILVAVSGGQDSLCLAKLLLDLQPKWQWQLAIVHCDHRWRADSSANAAFVQHLAQTWKLPYFQQTADEIPPTEATAREWRYAALATIAQQQGYDQVVTGHTASDRAETLLYNLIRGSGADGLQALTWQRPLVPGVTLVRPLLEITRQQTGEFCQEQQLPVWEDSTNQDLSHARNRIRLDVLTYLRTHLNPQVDRTLARTAELLQADVEFLEQEAAQLLQQASPDRVSLDRRVLQVAPIALQRRAMRQLLQALLPVPPEFEHIEKLVALIKAPNRSQTDPFPSGTIAQVQGDWIHFLSTTTTDQDAPTG
ncbi:MAG: tRNA lysidine(34) synthetase TilS [Leptolyngbyaceae cyanobacterium bins.302]|nr:tRNA lysidine(34) synthetase TilS [Leptolyngbyaceae cyanobacterium bins.302]